MRYRDSVVALAMFVMLLSGGCGGKKQQAQADKDKPKANSNPETVSPGPKADDKQKEPTGPGAKAKVPGKLPNQATPPKREDDKTLPENDKAKKAAGKAGNFLGGLFGARKRAQNLSITNNFKQISLGMHNHHDTFRELADDIRDKKTGKPLLSWRVKLLPFIEGSSLYDRFKLDEPWDSPNNKPLIAEMPSVYGEPRVDSQGKTRVLLVKGKNAAFNGERAPRFRDIRDGMSSTVMIVRAGADKAVTWTQPADAEMKDGPPSTTLGKLDADGILTAMCDGSTWWLSPGLTAEEWRLIVDPKDDTPVQMNELSKRKRPSGPSLNPPANKK